MNQYHKPESNYEEGKRKHLCWRCRNYNPDFDRLCFNRKSCRTYGIDTASLHDLCKKFDYTEEGESLPRGEMILFRDSPERNEAWCIKCEGFDPMPFCYEEYLASEEWRQKRLKCFERDGYRCCICGSAKNLRAHHLTYERIGHEDADDLLTVCKKCHEKLHKGDTDANADD